MQRGFSRNSCFLCEIQPPVGNVILPNREFALDLLYIYRMSKERGELPMTTNVFQAPASKKPWQHFAILVLPFLTVAASFHWMAATFPTFHGVDETVCHFPVIQKYFAELPSPDFSDSCSSSGPLFHIIFAVVARVVGLNLQALRLVNVLVSVLAVFLFYDIVGRFTRGNAALLFALLFGLSPYFFGASFLLLTDNLGILFALLSLRSFFLARETGMPLPWIAFCFWTCLATVTRQPYVWLCVGAGLGLVMEDGPLRLRAWKASALLLACVPLILLIVLWRGLTPPMTQKLSVAPALNWRAGIFGVSVFGLYWMGLFPAEFVGMIRRLRQATPPALAGSLMVPLALLFLMPLTAQVGDDGILWRLSRLLPSMGGTGLMFWFLFPVGLLFFWQAARSEEKMTPALLLMAVAFLLCSLPNAKMYEKYYDPFVIMFIIFMGARDQVSSALSKFSRSLLLFAFACYPFVSWRLSP